MVDSTKACESAYLDKDLVNASPTKKAIIISGGQYVTGKYGERLELMIEIDTKQKKWSPNRKSANNLTQAYTKDTNRWVGKVISVQVEMDNGKLTILGLPASQAEPIPVEEVIDPEFVDEKMEAKADLRRKYGND